MHKNLVGEKFGRWTVLSQGPKKNSHYSWVCECECGTVREVLGIHLKGCKTLSCGCLKLEYSAKRLTTHGKSKTAEYSTWTRMVDRCTNPNNPNWDRYGGRGIKISDEWRHDFELFLADMGMRPTSEHSIDRINNDGDYTKENCRWATKKEQSRNTSRNRMVIVDGKSISLAEASDVLGLHYSNAKWRLNTHGTLTNDETRPPFGEKKTSNLGA